MAWWVPGSDCTPAALHDEVAHRCSCGRKFSASTAPAGGICICGLELKDGPAPASAEAPGRVALPRFMAGPGTRALRGSFLPIILFDSILAEEAEDEDDE